MNNQINEMLKQDLMELHEKEKKVIEQIQQENHLSDKEIKHFPNFIPVDKVKYIFIGMEPSLGGVKGWEDKALSGLFNFMLTWEDFILHYCIKEYLKKSYYLTDISKAGMTIDLAKKLRKYEDWENLLKEEINIVGNDKRKLITIGKTVSDQLNKWAELKKPASTILHYSRLAAPCRFIIPELFKDEYANFKFPSYQEIKDFAENFLTQPKEFHRQNEIASETVKRVLLGLKDESDELSGSKKQLIFTYFKQFEAIKNTLAEMPI